MHLGLVIPRTGEHDTTDLAIEAEAQGYDSAWMGELWGTKSVVRLSEIAARTDDIEIGTAIVNVFSRTPAVLAMTAATLDQVSDGRASFSVDRRGRIELRAQPVGTPDERGQREDGGHKLPLADEQAAWRRRPAERDASVAGNPVSGEDGAALFDAGDDERESGGWYTLAATPHRTSPVAIVTIEVAIRGETRASFRRDSRKSAALDRIGLSERRSATP